MITIELVASRKVSGKMMPETIVANIKVATSLLNKHGEKLLGGLLLQGSDALIDEMKHKKWILISKTNRKSKGKRICKKS